MTIRLQLKDKYIYKFVIKNINFWFS